MSAHARVAANDELVAGAGGAARRKLHDQLKERSAGARELETRACNWRSTRSESSAPSKKKSRLLLHLVYVTACALWGLWDSRNWRHQIPLAESGESVISG